MPMRVNQSLLHKMLGDNVGILPHVPRLVKRSLIIAQTAIQLGEIWDKYIYS